MLRAVPTLALVVLFGCQGRALETERPARAHLLAESAQPITPEAAPTFLDRAERYLLHVQREVPSPLRARSTRVLPGLLVVEADLLTVERFTSPVMHAMVGGFPIRAELAVTEFPWPRALWRVYYVGRHELSENFAPFSDALFETCTQVILSEELW